MTLAQLAPQPALIDQVHDRLLAAIVDGELAPGMRLTQEGLAELLGVSRQPVSHALQVLKRRGLVIEAGRRGLSVAPVEPLRVRQLYQVREVLDALAARLAAERIASGELAFGALTGLGRIVDRGIGLGLDTPASQRIALDVEFHSIIHQLSGNGAIGELVAEQWPHFMRSMGLVLASEPTRARVWSEHGSILDAIRAGEPDAAERLARAHAARAGAETAVRLAAAAPPTSEPAVTGRDGRRG